MRLRTRRGGFTVIELLIVMAIILVLAGLILGTTGYVQKKGARSRAEAEISALSAAIENYKADNGIYPRDDKTDKLDAKADTDVEKSASIYAEASLSLYKSLSGAGADRKQIAGAKSYFPFKPNMLSPRDDTKAVTALADPFGNSYGYSTAYAADLEKTPDAAPTRGYNPTFDLWSTAGTTGTAASPADVQWIKNW